jgi:hypothetical protein
LARVVVLRRRCRRGGLRRQVLGGHRRARGHDLQVVRRAALDLGDLASRWRRAPWPRSRCRRRTRVASSESEGTSRTARRYWTATGSRRGTGSRAPPGT